MSALVFPLAALAALFCVVMPAVTLVARAILRRRRARCTWHAVGGHTTFALLVAPTLLPLAWLASSALHGSEPARALESCLVDHLGAAHCVDAVVLLGLLLAAVAGVTIRRLHVERVGTIGRPLPPDDPRHRRITALVGGLAPHPIVVAEGAPAPAFVHGWLRPRIVLDAAYVDDEDDAVLAAVLLHEIAHADARDPLRSFVARLCLALNPLGGRLRAELSHWQQAREIGCDAEAVDRGADRFALAEGIVRAARRPRPLAPALAPAFAPLCGHDPLALRLRVVLLLEPVAPTATDRAGRLLAIALLAAAALPHLLAPGAFEGFHHLVERLVLDAPL